MKVKKIDDFEHITINGMYSIINFDEGKWNVYKRSEYDNKLVSFVWSFKTLKEAIKFIENIKE